MNHEPQPDSAEELSAMQYGPRAESWEDSFQSWEVGAFQPTVRENLHWYKENGSDDGDLVIAEEAIFEVARTKLAEAFKAGEKKENEAWLRGERCTNCGREREPDTLADMCSQCYQDE